MSHAVEWVITADRRVVLALDGPLSAEPVRIGVTARGTLVVETADGLTRSFPPPDRRVAEALAERAEVLITEASRGPVSRRTTVLPTAPDAPTPGARA